MTGTFQQTSFPTQDPTTYKSSIDANFAVLSRLAAPFAPHAQSTPNMTVQVDAGFVFDGINLTTVAAQTASTFTGPVSNPRIDRIVSDLVTGTISVITGTEASSPTAPAIPAGTSPIAQIALAVGVTAITPTMITDERTASNGGGFGYAVSIASAATVDLGSVGGHNVVITGSTGVTSLGTSASLNRPIFLVRFTGALTITQSANLLLPGGGNILTQNGDSAIAEYQGSGVWQVRDYQRVDGSSINAFLGDSGSGGFHGLVPAPPAGSAANGAYLSAAGSFTRPPCGLVPLSAATASSSSALVFTFDGTYDYYIFEIIDLFPSTNTNIVVRTSSNSGSSFDAGASDYATTSYSYNSSPTSGVFGGVQSFINLTAYSQNIPSAGIGLSGRLSLYKPSTGAAFKSISGVVVGYGSYIWGQVFHGLRESVSPVNAIQFSPASGVLSSGEIIMYGGRNS